MSHRKLAVAIKWVLNPGPCPGPSFVLSKASSCWRRGTSSLQADTQLQEMEALTLYLWVKSGKWSWPHIYNKTSISGGVGTETATHNQPQTQGDEAGVLRESHPQGPGIYGLPKMEAQDGLGCQRTPHLTPEADTTCWVTSNHCLSVGRGTGKNETLGKILQQPSRHAEHTVAPWDLEAAIAMN